MQNKKKVGGSDKLEIAGVSIADNPSSGPDLCPTFLDRGASAHCFQSSVQFVPGSLTSCAPCVIALADKSTVVANQVGKVLLSFENANLRLTDVLLVPEMRYNLVSCGRPADKGIEFRFSSESVSLDLGRKGDFHWVRRSPSEKWHVCVGESRSARHAFSQCIGCVGGF